MAHPHDDREQDPANEGATPKGRRLGRILIPLGILLALAAIFTYILVVARSGAEDDSDVYDNEGAAAVVVEAPAAL
ncbi:hypothetical protein [Blastococcus sp. VKM Ac-2987]|uniref:hypothetical protein n=1 Tax=Blastococcus sp. VKM Ac-2987 TaxID=3004141 RepID=UPI0022ABBF0B|nr:hypothetical protein [Blastococcus sp. VKM Ac-2987]MCZ2860047.1 hypothetical protein [Blastococcus sp. VKM Ac-2987]